MTSTRPTNESQLDLLGTEETCAGSAAELQTEQSASAALEKPALNNVPIDLREQIVDQENMETAWDQVCFKGSNRLVRTRMLGGVGGVPGNRAPIPMDCYPAFRIRDHSMSLDKA